MLNRMFAALAVMAFAVVGVSASSASASSAGNAVNAKKCGVSDRSDVTVNKKTDTVTVRGDTRTAGNNFYCYTNIPVAAGDIVTFDFLGTCGGGTPRVFLQFDGGASGENTFDNGACTQLTADTGTVTYTITKAGTITAFAEIHDRDNGQTTYSNLVIDGTRINF